jgi:hypothetical protein
MMISAEEEVPSVEEIATGNRQSKQIYYLVPQLSPASTYPESYLEGSSPYELPLMMPKQSPFIRRYPVRKQQLSSSNWPYTHHPLLSSPGIINRSLNTCKKNFKKKLIQLRNSIQRT